jgi:hypothetical protein
MSCVKCVGGGRSSERCLLAGTWQAPSSGAEGRLVPRSLVEPLRSREFAAVKATFFYVANNNASRS